MARGRDAHEARKAALAALGKDLARRARSRCELCGEKGALSAYEPPPAPEDPALDEALLLCGGCRDAVDGRSEPDAMRFLQTAIWAELPIARVVAVRLAEGLATGGVDWASDLLDQVWIDDDLRARVDAR